jgi:hypothetical protein
VKEVTVSLYRAAASVVHEASLPVEELIAAIDGAGYNAVVREPGEPAAIPLDVRRPPINPS